MLERTFGYPMTSINTPPDDHPATSSPASGSSLRRWVMWSIVSIVGVGLGVYIGIAAFVAHVLTIPPREPITGTPKDDENLDYESVRFPARTDGLSIAGWFLPNPESEKAVIFVHGAGQCRTLEFHGRGLEFAAALQRHGYNILMIDLRGHGESADSRFTYGILERRDVLGAVDWLQERGFEPGMIGVIGVSMGAASSIGAAAQEPAIGAVVSDSTYAEFEETLRSEFPKKSNLPNLFLPPVVLTVQILTGVDITTSRPIEEVGKIAPRPMLFIHANGDETIPIEHAERLAAAAPSKEDLWIIEADEHAKTFNTEPERYVERVAEFFSMALHPAVPSPETAVLHR